MLKKSLTKCHLKTGYKFKIKEATINTWQTNTPYIMS